MMTIASRDHGRDNNFNLLRFLAAFGVLVSHAWPIALGEGAVEPAKMLTGQSLGELCVYVFFAVSGYFIARSMGRGSRPLGFVLARALRVLPGLFVVLVLTVLVLGPAVGTAPASQYWARVPHYIASNMTLFRLEYGLPGVFANNPYPAIINGSLWTLRFEILCYAFVFFGGLIGLLKRPIAMSGFAVAIAILFILSKIYAFSYFPFHLLDLGFPFALGSLAWSWRERVPLDVRLVALLLGAAAICRLALGAEHVIFVATLAVAIAYTSLWFGFADLGLGGFNRLGDYSYGIYIYAFPVQQAVAWSGVGAGSPLANIAGAAPIVMILAVLSWHMIEAPALKLKAGKRRAAMAPVLAVARAEP